MDKRYIYRGNVSGLSAQIAEPHGFNISVGASSLSVNGGYSQSYSDASIAAGGGVSARLAALFGKRVDYPPVLSYKSVRTQATGAPDEREKAYKTLAHCTIKGLVVEDRLTARCLEAILQSTHPQQEDENLEPRIVPSGTGIMDLKIDGYDIDIEYDIDLFTRYPTRADLAKAYAENKTPFDNFRQRFRSVGQFSPQDNSKTSVPQLFDKKHDVIVTSIVSGVDTRHPEIEKVQPNILIVPNFGRVYLGELLISNAYRRMTLLRLKLGSPIHGDVACAGVEINGVIMD